MFLINKKCVYREKISSDRENLIALILINIISHSLNNLPPPKKKKKIKKTKTYLNETMPEKQDRQSALVNVFSKLLSTNKFKNYL